MKKTSNQIQKAVTRNPRTTKTVNSVQTAKKVTYKRITKNIYHNGFSYCARVMVNGTMLRRSFTSQRKATIWRNEVKRGSVR
jgi:hypothetical protein